MNISFFFSLSLCIGILVVSFLYWAILFIQVISTSSHGSFSFSFTQLVCVLEGGVGSVFDSPLLVDKNSLVLFSVRGSNHFFFLFFFQK